jgi:hypothetical protein
VNTLLADTLRQIYGVTAKNKIMPKREFVRKSQGKKRPDINSRRWEESIKMYVEVRGLRKDALP